MKPRHGAEALSRASILSARADALRGQARSLSDLLECAGSEEWPIETVGLVRCARKMIRDGAAILAAAAEDLVDPIDVDDILDDPHYAVGGTD